MAHHLRDLTGLTSAPVGWWGWSQGAWVATLAAQESPSTFVILVGYSIQNPADQMRLFTRNLLEQAGYGATALAELRTTREAYEGYLRGTTAESVAAEMIATYRDRPWFELAWVPDPPLPDAAVREWMVTLQPRRVLAQLRCTVTAIWGSRHDVVDVEAGRASLHDLGTNAHAYVLDDADHGLSMTNDHVPMATYDQLLADESRWHLADGSGEPLATHDPHCHPVVLRVRHDRHVEEIWILASTERA